MLVRALELELGSALGSSLCLIGKCVFSMFARKVFSGEFDCQKTLSDKTYKP